MKADKKHGTLSASDAMPCCLSSLEERRQVLRERARKWRAEHPERAKAIREKWRMENPEKQAISNKASVKKWQSKNPDKVKAMSRQWAARNRDKVKANQEKWLAKNPAQGWGRVKQWMAANPDKVRQIRANWREKNDDHLKAYYKKRTVEMPDSYIASLLCHGTSLKKSDLPQELVELKRKQLKIHRQLKNNES